MRESPHPQLNFFEKSPDVVTTDSSITRLLKEMGEGRDDAVTRVLEAVYAELRRMAEVRMRSERPDHTLQPTALVHEAFIRMVGNRSDLTDRARFFGAAARAMERVLIDHARARAADKRGGGSRPLSLHDVHPRLGLPPFRVVDVGALTEVLDELSPENAEYVRLRYFIGLSLEEIAEIQNLSLATVKRRWSFIRAWLYDRIARS